MATGSYLTPNHSRSQSSLFTPTPLGHEVNLEVRHHPRTNALQLRPATFNFLAVGGAARQMILHSMSQGWPNCLIRHGNEVKYLPFGFLQDDILAHLKFYGNSLNEN
ncbi:hypothetical protein TNCV_2472981 [Trichonephila clavipes]|nr:hypothetical protein TNCV_2472981 [Trichonephila clavipes]